MGIRASSQFTAESAHRSIVADSADGVTVVDLSRTRFMEPAGLVAIAAVVDRAARSAQQVQVIPPPINSDCSKYLHRMGLHTLLAGFGVECVLAEVNHHDVGHRLMELTRFGSSHPEWDELERTVFGVLSTNLGLPAAKLLYTPVAEIGANVVEHSKSADGYLALQSYPNAGVLRFAIADAGIGLRGSLERSHAVESDAHAVELASTEGVSGTPEEGRGLGITGVIQRSADAGAVTLFSGAASGTTSSGTPMQVGNSASPFPGTLVGVTLRVA